MVKTSSNDLASALDVVLLDAAATPTTLRAQLGGRPAVVVFLRHFG